MLKTILMFILVISSCQSIYASYESAVETLILPFGARTTGMGEVGTALADDESVLFWNPAGLGVENKSWHRGAASLSFEPLLPAFKLRDRWHATLSGCYQFPRNIGGFGTYYHHNNLGKSEWYNFDRGEGGNRWEGIWAAGWGCSLDKLGDSTRYFGIALKPFVSVLFPSLGNHGEGTAQGFAIDFGYLRVLRNGLRFGLTLANMGPAIFYFDEKAKGPIPFTINTAIAFKRRVESGGIEKFRIAAEFRLSKELVVTHYDRNPDPFFKAFFTEWGDNPFSQEVREIAINTGMEMWFIERFGFRQGFLWDKNNSRIEWHHGVGINLSRYIRGDWSYIYAPEGFMRKLAMRYDEHFNGATGIQDGQWQLTITVEALSGWKSGK